jgi:hypothetical protein
MLYCGRPSAICTARHRQGASYCPWPVGADRIRSGQVDNGHGVVDAVGYVGGTAVWGDGDGRRTLPDADGGSGDSRGQPDRGKRAAGVVGDVGSAARPALRPRPRWIGRGRSRGPGSPASGLPAGRMAGGRILVAEPVAAWPFAGAFSEVARAGATNLGCSPMPKAASPPPSALCVDRCSALAGNLALALVADQKAREAGVRDRPRRRQRSEGSRSLHRYR